MRVTNIEFFDVETLTMDIEVDKVHNYTLANGCVVHNSSVACSTTNGPYPIRSLSITKTSGNTTAKWVAPEATKYRDRYDIAWEMSNEDHIKVYSILQAFLDQSISADFYVDRRGNKEISMAQMFKEVALMAKYGQITRYYYNSIIENDATVDFTKVTHEESCGSGGCTL